MIIVRRRTIQARLSACIAGGKLNDHYSIMTCSKVSGGIIRDGKNKLCSLKSSVQELRQVQQTAHRSKLSLRNKYSQLHPLSTSGHKLLHL